MKTSFNHNKVNIQFYVKSILIGFALFIISINSIAQQNNQWKKVKNEEDIQVYVLKFPHKEIVKAKTMTIINVPMNQVIAVLDDIDKRHEWVPFLKISKSLSKYENNKRIEYSHFKAPWPATDRDFVYQTELIFDTKTKKIYKMQTVISNLMPVKNDKIRADLYESIYTLTAIDNQTTAVELIFYANPKGWLPNWIINIIQQVLPFKIIKNLKKRVVKQQK